MSQTLTIDQQRFVQQCRVGHLSTVDHTGEAYTVPVCYAFDGHTFYTPVDEKPKRADRRLKRIRNIEETGRATLLVDRYDDNDWSQLAWVMIRGQASVMQPDHPNHDPVIELLRERHQQYREMRLETAEVIVLKPERVTSWGRLQRPE